MYTNVASIITAVFTAVKVSYCGSVSTTVFAADDATASNAIEAAGREAFRTTFKASYFATREQTIGPAICGDAI